MDVQKTLANIEKKIKKCQSGKELPLDSSKSQTSSKSRSTHKFRQGKRKSKFANSSRVKPVIKNRFAKLDSTPVDRKSNMNYETVDNYQTNKSKTKRKSTKSHNRFASKGNITTK